MKLLLLFFGIFFFTIGHTQTVIEYQSHALIPGDKQQMLKVDFITPTEGGKNQVWDFSKLHIYAEENSLIEKAQGINKHSIAPSANIVINTGEKFNSFFYIDDVSNQCLAYGNEKYQIVYSKPIIRMLYPFSFGNYYTNSYSAKGVYENNTETDISGEYTFEADATGTLILADDTIPNVLRIRTETNKYEFMRCYHSEMQQVKYLYYSQQRYPVFASVETRWITNEKDTNYHRSCAVNRTIEKQESSKPKPNIPVNPKNKDKKEYVISISPNPFHGEINTEFILEEPTYVTVELISIEGHKLANICASRTLNAGRHQYSYDAARFANTNYLVRFTFNEQMIVRQIIKTN